VPFTTRVTTPQVEPMKSVKDPGLTPLSGAVKADVTASKAWQ